MKLVSWRLILACVVLAWGVSRLQNKPEPIQCEIMRDLLERTYTVDAWMLPATGKVGEVPVLPFALVAACGPAALNMDYAYKTRFAAPGDVGPTDKLPEGDILDPWAVLEARNRSVRVRPVEPYDPTSTDYFGGLQKLSEGSERDASVAAASECAKNQTCALYFDNTWTTDDVGTMLGEKHPLVDLLSSALFGSAFLANFKFDMITATMHSAPLCAIALQFSSRKRWTVVQPHIARKFLKPRKRLQVNVIGPFTQDQTEVLSHLPHYDVTTGPGEALYLPEFWYHIVHSGQGDNFLVNFRVAFRGFKYLWNSPNPLLPTLKGWAVLMGVDSLGLVGKLTRGDTTHDRLQDEVRITNDAKKSTYVLNNPFEDTLVKKWP